ncbi:hypothetical protein TWF225_003907 [Orbilia oligospora]|nr:hypothetical protein TWF751_000948 [Orbilia oligospora]KAF3188137.1 hypothetical protein TWF225_003907 [Orbilia oligospora]KAF3248643.1 hypothetical protein TWF128_008355 [Orbilia oligospora]KAF3258682.1 hypothetical protein TWF217_005451 [Orbilia oligospora]
MHIPTLLTVLTLLPSSLSIPLISRRQSPCFVIGSTPLPAETLKIANGLASIVTCDASVRPLQNIPDTISGGVKFSSINFENSDLLPLDFALTAFSTPSPPSSASLTLFTNRLNTYLAQEAAVRSIGGSLSIKAPKFFLAFQVARIKTSRGIPITDPGQTVEHLLEKVIKNAGRVSQVTKDEVTRLAKDL